MEQHVRGLWHICDSAPGLHECAVTTQCRRLTPALCWCSCNQQFLGWNRLKKDLSRCCEEMLVVQNFCPKLGTDLNVIHERTEDNLPSVDRLWLLSIVGEEMIYKRRLFDH